MSVQILIKFINPLILIVLILGRLLSLYFYLNVLFSIINFSNPKPRKLTLPSTLLSISLTSLFLINLLTLLIYALAMLHKPQRHWNTILSIRYLIWSPRNRHKGNYSNRTWTTWLLTWQRPIIQYYCYSSRFPNNFLSSYTCIYWGIWKLITPLDISYPRHSFPTTK